jgi:hypothetical protein
MALIIYQPFTSLICNYSVFNEAVSSQDTFRQEILSIIDEMILSVIDSFHNETFTEKETKQTNFQSSEQPEFWIENNQHQSEDESCFNSENEIEFQYTQESHPTSIVIPYQDAINADSHLTFRSCLTDEDSRLLNTEESNFHNEDSIQNVEIEISKNDYDDDSNTNIHSIKKFVDDKNVSDNSFTIDNLETPIEGLSSLDNKTENYRNFDYDSEMKHEDCQIFDSNMNQINGYDKFVVEKMFEKRKGELEKQAEIRAKRICRRWEQDKVTLQRAIDESLKEYVDLYEKAQALHSYIQHQQSVWKASIIQQIKDGMELRDTINYSETRLDEQKLEAGTFQSDWEKSCRNQQLTPSSKRSSIFDCVTRFDIQKEIELEPVLSKTCVTESIYSNDHSIEITENFCGIYDTNQVKPLNSDSNKIKENNGINSYKMNHSFQRPSILRPFTAPSKKSINNK